MLQSFQWALVEARSRSKANTFWRGKKHSHHQPDPIIALLSIFVIINDSIPVSIGVYIRSPTKLWDYYDERVCEQQEQQHRRTDANNRNFILFDVSMDMSENSVVLLPSYEFVMQELWHSEQIPIQLVCNQNNENQFAPHVVHLDHYMIIAIANKLNEYSQWWNCEVTQKKAHTTHAHTSNKCTIQTAISSLPSCNIRRN